MTTDIARSLQRAERRRQQMAVALTLPLLVFLLLTFLVPIGALLKRAIENPEVADVLVHTGRALATWDRQGEPPAPAFAALAQDLGALPESAQAGTLARRLNSEVAGARSLIMGTYRALPLSPPGEALTPEQVREKLLAVDPRWSEAKYWQAIAKNSSRWTPDYLLASVDHRRSAAGAIEPMPPDQAVFVKILLRTFNISAVVTVLCLLLAYPLAYWLSTLEARRANVDQRS